MKKKKLKWRNVLELTGSVERWCKAVGGVRINESGDSHFAVVVVEIILVMLVMRHHRHVHDDGGRRGRRSRSSASLGFRVDGGRNQFALRGGRSLR